jgi:hypothetical protein
VDAFETCASCARHVKRSETSCPFCGSPRMPGCAAPSVPSRRMSRAQWLALGSAFASVACAPGSIASSGDESRPHESAVRDAAAGQVAPNDAEALDASASDGDAATVPEGGGDDGADGAAVCPSLAPGTFVCGTTAVCDRATEYCWSGRPSWADGNCFTYDDAGVNPLPAQCLGCPTCDCLAMNAGYVGGGFCPFGAVPWGCIDVEGGGIVLSCGHNSCYGAPAARARRRVRSVS